MSKQGTELTCFVIARGGALETSAAQLTEILQGKAQAASDMSFARWEFGAGAGTRAIGFRLPELIELPWEAQDDDDPARQIWVLSDVGAARKEVRSLLDDGDELTERIAEITEDDETDRGRLRQLVERLAGVLDAAKKGDLVLFGLAC